MEARNSILPRHEPAHKMNLKDGWNTFNHNLNYLPQVLTCQHRILCFEIRELDLQAIGQCRENSAAASYFLLFCADLSAPDGSQSYAKLAFMRPQNRGDGMHPDAMIKDISALLDNTQDVTHHAAIYSGTGECIKHNSRKKTYISNEQLHTLEICIYQGIKIQVEGLDGEHIFQRCRCTGSQSWRGVDRRNDCVWVKQRLGRCYGAVNGHIPWQLQQLFQMKILNEDGAFVEYWSALGLTTIPGNSGNLDPVSKLVQVRKAPAAIAWQVFSMGNIVGCAHVIPATAISI
jgi:acid stress-induced BolA-like protein IbaG/YrbA